MQECFYSTAEAVSDPLLVYAKLEIFQLSFNYENVVCGWDNQNETVWEKGDRTVLAVEEEMMIPRCSLQLDLEMTPYTPSNKAER